MKLSNVYKALVWAMVRRRRSSTFSKECLSYDVVSGSEITPCNAIDKPIVVYKFLGHVLASTTTLRT